MLFSSPRLRFSEQQKLAILDWAKELRAQDVPTLGMLEKCQDHIKRLVGCPTEKFTSLQGTVFFINDIGKAIAKVFNRHIFYFVYHLY
jgi:hypothetical protein